MAETLAGLMERSEPVAEFTLKAVVAGIVFGAANAYLGLRVAMTVSASIPAAVMTVALFKLVRSGDRRASHSSGSMASNFRPRKGFIFDRYNTAF